MDILGDKRHLSARVLAFIQQTSKEPYSVYQRLQGMHRHPVSAPALLWEPIAFFLQRNREDEFERDAHPLLPQMLLKVGVVQEEPQPR